jgi:hypothetical protein
MATPLDKTIERATGAFDLDGYHRLEDAGVADPLVARSMLG